MENDILSDFIFDALEEQIVLDAKENRRKYFQEIGRKGGLAKKSTPTFKRRITVWIDENDDAKLRAISKKYQLSISTLVRMILFMKTLQVNEHKTEETLLSYATNFKRIASLMNRQDFILEDSRATIITEIKFVLEEIKKFLQEKNNR